MSLLPLIANESILKWNIKVWKAQVVIKGVVWSPWTETEHFLIVPEPNFAVEQYHTGHQQLEALKIVEAIILGLRWKQEDKFKVSFG